MSIGVSDGINMKKSNIRGICTRNCNSGVWLEIKGVWVERLRRWGYSFRALWKMNLLGCLFVNLVEIYINLAEIYINLAEIYRWENDLVKSYARAYIFCYTATRLLIMY